MSNVQAEDNVQAHTGNSNVPKKVSQNNEHTVIVVMHKQITTSASKMTFESKWKLMWIFKQGVNIAVTDVLIVDAVKAIVDAIDDVVVVVIVVVVAVKAIVVAVDVVVVAAVVVVVARKQSKFILTAPLR